MRRSRELAAIQAQREVERMKLEDQRKKIEMVCWIIIELIGNLLGVMLMFMAIFTWGLRIVPSYLNICASVS